MVATVVTAPPSEEDKRVAERRRGLLLAALVEEGVSQTKLIDMLRAAGERTSPATVSNWCRGAVLITEVQLRGLLFLIGKDRDWTPSEELVRRALDEQEGRQRIPVDQRKKPKRPKPN